MQSTIGFRKFFCLMFTLLLTLGLVCSCGRKSDDVPESTNVSSEDEIPVESSMASEPSSTAPSMDVSEEPEEQDPFMKSVNEYLVTDMEDGTYVTQYLGDLEEDYEKVAFLRTARIEGNYILITSNFVIWNPNYLGDDINYEYGTRAFELSDDFEIFSMVNNYPDDEKKDNWTLQEFNESFDFDSIDEPGALGLGLLFSFEDGELVSIEVFS